MVETYLYSMQDDAELQKTLNYLGELGFCIKRTIYQNNYIKIIMQREYENRK